MRSQYVFDATLNVANRYQLVTLVAKAARALHRPGTRIQDTMNRALVWYSRANVVLDVQADHRPIAIATRRNKPPVLTKAALGRNRRSGDQSAEAPKPADRSTSDVVSPIKPPGGNHIRIAGPVLPQQSTWRLQ
jgi:hypothetical protein